MKDEVSRDERYRKSLFLMQNSLLPTMLSGRVLEFIGQSSHRWFEEGILEHLPPHEIGRLAHPAVENLKEERQSSGNRAYFKSQNLPQSEAKFITGIACITMSSSDSEIRRDDSRLPCVRERHTET